MNLIELIIAIVVISIAVSGVLLVFTQTVRYSADPMIQQQAIAIAEGYMDEILARPVTDPDGTNAGETRATYDNAGDYHGLNQVPTDQNGNPLPGLADYSVSVVVNNVSLGPGGATVPAAQVLVSVTRPPIVDFTLTGYRAN